MIVKCVSSCAFDAVCMYHLCAFQSTYTSSGPADYIGGTFTAQFGTEADARFCQNIQTVLDTDVEPDDENFLVNIVIIPGSPLRPGTPDTATVFITGMKDTVLCITWNKLNV